MTLLITILVIPIVNSLNINEKSTKEINKSFVRKINFVEQKLCVPKSQLNIPLVKGNRPPNMAWPAFDYPGDQTHPAFDRTLNGTHLAAYKDYYDGNIWWHYSEDDGATYNNGSYIPGKGGDYPSIKLWKDTTLYATFVPEPTDNNGSAIYLLKTDEPTSYPDYTLESVNMSDYGWSSIIDADIACDSSQNHYEWGISSYVMTTATNVNAPVIVYSHDAYNWTISWEPTIFGCSSCDVDIDNNPPVFGVVNSYTVYSWHNYIIDRVELLVRVDNFADMQSGPEYYYYGGLEFGNLTNPSVAAGNGNIVIVTETDRNGTKDIMCFYGQGQDMEHLSNSTIEDDDDPENTANATNPHVEYIGDYDFVVIYNKHFTCSMPKDLMAEITHDGGASWNEQRWQVNDNDNCVVEGYKTTDLCGQGAFAMWTENDTSDELDIYIGPVIQQNQPPEAPSITGPSNGKTGTSYDFTFNAVDPDGDNVRYIIDWGDSSIDNTTLNPSGVNKIVSHTWTAENTYVITAYAIDEFGLEGPETEKTFTAPRTREINNRYLNFLRYHPNMFPILRLLLQQFGL